jgi:hypothetical protein
VRKDDRMIEGSSGRIGPHALHSKFKLSREEHVIVVEKCNQLACRFCHSLVAGMSRPSRLLVPNETYPDWVGGKGYGVR